MSESYVRYKKNEIMPYWYMKNKALCISSQAKKCYDHETISMLVKFIKHKTRLKVKRHSTDISRQSLIDFAICHLLEINLQPKIKIIRYLKISKADCKIAKKRYCNIEEMIKKKL